MYKKMLTTAGLSLALLGAAALPIQAFAGNEQAAATPITVEQADSLTVVRDPVTGQMRAPTADEVSVMQQERAAKARNFRRAPRAAMQKYHRNGARGARVSEEFETLSVAVRKPDGTVDSQCFDSKDAAEAAFKAGTLTTAIKHETE